MVFSEAVFVAHEPCPRCGSRDNLGRYSDGGAFCFGCGYKERSTHAPRREYEKKEDEKESYAKIPEDANHDFPQVAVEWLAQYGVGIPEAIQRGLLWSNSRQQLIFNMENLWQARNFNPVSAKKRKYFTQGDVNDHLPIYETSSVDKDTRSLVLVEDCVSALKIARWYDSMPLLGSHLSTAKLNRIAGLYGPLARLFVWLDSDKLTEAKKICERGKYLGLSTKVIYTELDPKFYIDSKIKEYLQ